MLVHLKRDFSIAKCEERVKGKVIRNWCPACKAYVEEGNEHKATPKVELVAVLTPHKRVFDDYLVGARAAGSCDEYRWISRDSQVKGIRFDRLVKAHGYQQVPGWPNVVHEFEIHRVR